MALATTTTRTPKVTRCPVCGGLECLCRPRFFAGQLLTEDDLNRLERYIIDKNKLHNRYLHGWGVVCGLEVMCNPCKGFVTVKSGYALGPCGDDIVVCRDADVNVCELIQQCRQHQWDCEPAWPRPDPICGDQDEPWILYVCYDEKPSRGITPLHGDRAAACCPKCSCGGSSSCGCGGTSISGQDRNVMTTSEQQAYRRTSLKTPPQCEPTVQCEGYKFQLRKASPTATKGDLGELVNGLQECLKDFTQPQTAIDNLSTSSQPANQILAIKATLTNLANHHSISDCALFKRISDVSSTAPIGEVQQTLSLINFELFKECFCSALLPSCGPPADENCVPLATVTLNCKGGCNVVRICNVENRRLVITIPTLEYWLESLFRLLGVGDAVSQLCCRESGPRFDAVSRPDLMSSIFNQAVRQGGTVSSQFVFQQLGALWKEMTAFTRQ